MTLHLIEQAIKPQFTWASYPKRKLKGENKDRVTELPNPIVIFIGIASSFNIPPIDIIDYLSIGETEYRRKKAVFDVQWGIVLNRKGIGTLHKKKDITDRIYLKTKLTLNALNSLQKGCLECSGLNIG